jgi:hypothetical protein
MNTPDKKTWRYRWHLTAATYCSRKNDRNTVREEQLVPDSQGRTAGIWQTERNIKNLTGREEQQESDSRKEQQRPDRQGGTAGI